MRSFLLYIILTLGSFVDAVFSTGGFAIVGKPRQDWIVGSTKQVSYTTIMKDYSIALWQFIPGKTEGNMAKVLFETTNGPASSFTWTVDTYGLDLNVSTMFHFRLFQGASTNQGRADSPHISSTIFNILLDPPTSSSTSSSPTSSATSVSPTTPSSQPTGASSSTPASSSTTSASSSSSGTSHSSSGLSTGAKAGIGVGVSVGALCALAALFFLLRRHRRKHPAPVEADDGYMRETGAPFGAGGLANPRSSPTASPVHTVSPISQAQAQTFARGDGGSSSPRSMRAPSQGNTSHSVSSIEAEKMALQQHYAATGMDTYNNNTYSSNELDGAPQPPVQKHPVEMPDHGLVEMPSHSISRGG